MTPQEILIALNMIPGLGSIRIMRLMDFFPSPELILEAPKSMLREIAGIGDMLAHSIATWRDFVNLPRELETADRAGVQITTLFDDHYPELLRQIDSPPPVLYHQGDWTNDDCRKAIAIVGSRMATHYGRLCAKKFAYELAEEGVCIISGLAKGIDTLAHEGALDCPNGRTIAVIGAGLNKLYPQENRLLAQRIADGRGAVVSEFPMDMPPSKSSFPMRNRIVSGWSHGVLVVEAPARSGSLITARLAAEQGRHTFCIPGPIDRHSSDGCHALIRDGSILVTSPKDITEELRWTGVKQQELPLFDGPDSSAPTKPTPVLTPKETEILQVIGMGFNTVDSLCSATGMPAYELTPLLTRLIIAGVLKPAPGGCYQL